MKNKKCCKLKQIIKNKILKRKNMGPNLKKSKQIKTATSIKVESELQEGSILRLSSQKQKDQMNYIKKILDKTFYDFNFSNRENEFLIKEMQSRIDYIPISIDKLFCSQEKLFSTDSFTFYEVSQYLKIVNNQLQNKKQNIILRKENENFNLRQQSNRQRGDQVFKGKFISLLEREVLLNRQNFMEKIKANQQKYKDCNSELSQISRQLIFLSKVYMENAQKIKRVGSQSVLKVTDISSEYQSETQKQYYNILIKKNIIRAFNEKQIDVLRYFQQKQEEQGKFNNFSLQNYDEDNLRNYLRGKKPRKSKLAKRKLPTSCSFCFSDYYEQINPLISCQNCSLRCHKNCLNFKSSLCGFCAYQRIPKCQKKIIQFCYICKQKGQMNINIETNINGNGPKYAHGFCLIFHQLWDPFIKKVFSQNQNELQKKLQKNQNEQENAQKIYNFKGQILNLQKYEKINDQCINNSEDQLDFDKDSNMIDYMENDLQKNCLNGNSLEIINKQDCQICKSSFQGQLYTRCDKCTTKCHAFCGFFEGFQFKPLYKNQTKNSYVDFAFNCCNKSQQERDKLRNKRKFILNKDRHLFENL